MSCTYFTFVSSPPQHLVDRVSGFMHVYTLYSAVRPFGCTALFASCGPEGPALYMADPSGVAWVCYNYECCVCVYGLRLCVCLQGYYGCAVGKAKQAAKTEIEKLKVCRALTSPIRTMIMSCI